MVALVNGVTVESKGISVSDDLLAYRSKHHVMLFNLFSILSYSLVPSTIGLVYVSLISQIQDVFS